MVQAKKGISTGGKLVTLGAAAAAAYWFYASHDAAKHRKEARSWMVRARADVQKAVKAAAKKTGALDKQTYINIVDSAMEKYGKLKDSVPSEVNQISKEIKAAWAHVQPQEVKLAKTVKKAVKKTVKTVKKAM